ncbi:hypothetical protein ASZ90_011218 [hydrocarbon metagenome]|uniref:Uncharacterized protein n=1 Tax=hydrocarbon metagenome TaxID=938273 RepID=A0A0W8FDV6_9ZZZZ|nr:hypothetical protein [Methanomicrobiaceae archaeon]
MPECAKRSISRILLEGLIGMVVFLTLVAAMNLLTAFTQNQIFLLIVGFLNAHLWLLIAIAILFLIGELFGALAFPLNLPAPLFNALGSVYFVTFFLRLFSLIDEITGLAVFSIFEGFAPLIYSAVFILVLIGGYIQIMVSQCRRGGCPPKEAAGGAPEEAKDRPAAGGKTWEEIGDEFRQTICDILQRIREDVNGR